MYIETSRLLCVLHLLDIAILPTNDSPKSSHVCNVGAHQRNPTKQQPPCSATMLHSGLSSEALLEPQQLHCSTHCNVDDQSTICTELRKDLCSLMHDLPKAHSDEPRLKVDHGSRDTYPGCICCTAGCYFSDDHLAINIYNKCMGNSVTQTRCVCLTYTSSCRSRIEVGVAGTVCLAQHAM